MSDTRDTFNREVNSTAASRPCLREYKDPGPVTVADHSVYVVTASRCLYIEKSQSTKDSSAHRGFYVPVSSDHSPSLSVSPCLCLSPSWSLQTIEVEDLHKHVKKIRFHGTVVVRVVIAESTFESDPIPSRAELKYIDPGENSSGNETSEPTKQETC